MVAVETSSARETECVAARLARHLRAGDLVTVAGELGAGKTTFVRGAARALGVDGPVTSPTYTVGHRYRADPDVSHLDLYRYEAVGERDWADFEEYFERAVAFVEWPERGAGLLPEARVSVRLRHLGTEQRLIEVETAEKILEMALSEQC